eukprot:m.256365 g.256365  ORF g.256365 m.256365 type:complete len:66 (+) comp34309_c0_seq1:187-384(+)
MIWRYWNDVYKRKKVEEGRGERREDRGERERIDQENRDKRRMEEKQQQQKTTTSVSITFDIIDFV